MPKVKTSRAAAKRFKVSGSGKLIRNKAYKSHILPSCFLLLHVKSDYKYGRIFFMTFEFVLSVTMSFLRFLLRFVDFFVKM